MPNNQVLKMLAAGTGGLSLLLSGCGGGDGDIGPADLVQSAAPRCTQSMVIDSELASTQVALTRLHELVELASISPDDGNGNNPASPTSFEIAGTCGGWMLFEPIADLGIEGQTDYQLDLQDYCVDSPDGDVTFLGQVRSSELAEATEEGLRASRLESDFSNVRVSQGNDAVIASMTSGITEYGLPTEGRPLPATQAAPDRLNIGHLSARQESTGRTDEITSFNADRWNDGEELQAMLIKSGRYLHGKSGDRFNMASASGRPLIVDPDNGEWLSGVVQLSSKNNPTVELRPNGNEGEVLMVVPGNAAGSIAGCGVIDKLGS